MIAIVAVTLSLLLSGVDGSEDDYDIISFIQDDLISIEVGIGEIDVPGSAGEYRSGSGAGFEDVGTTSAEEFSEAEYSELFLRCLTRHYHEGLEAINDTIGAIGEGMDALVEYCDPDEVEASEAIPSPALLGDYVRSNASTYIDAGDFQINPSRDALLVNKPVYFTSTARSYYSTATVLGVPIQLNLTPLSYAWDPGNGETFTSTDPGGPWPTGSQTYTYTKAGKYRPVVNTYWRVAISLDGITWSTVPGMGVTTAYANPLTVVEAESVLTTGNR